MRFIPTYSLGVLLIAVALFAPSFWNWRLYSAPRVGPTAQWIIYIDGGRVIAQREHWLNSRVHFIAKPSWRNAGGFTYEQERFTGTTDWTVGATTVTPGMVMHEHLAVPTYPVPALALVLLIWRWRCLWLQREPGHCVRCNYDLRTTPGRCPECGHTTAPDTPAR